MALALSSPAEIRPEHAAEGRWASRPFKHMLFSTQENL
jgi:hypothetical protein